MSHLPECWLSEGKFDAVCMCDRLRACEQRVREDSKAMMFRNVETICPVGSIIPGPALAAIHSLTKEAPMPNT